MPFNPSTPGEANAQTSWTASRPSGIITGHGYHRRSIVGTGKSLRAFAITGRGFRIQGITGKSGRTSYIVGNGRATLHVTGFGRNREQIPGTGAHALIVSGKGYQYGPLTVDVTTLTLTADGTGKANVGTVHVSEVGYSGQYTIVTADPSVVSTSLAADGTLTITALAVGVTTVSVYDDHGGAQTIAVTSYGELSAIVTTAPQSRVGQFIVSRAGYTGQFTITPLDNTPAIYSALTGQGPGPFVVNVTPETPGLTTLVRVTDAISGEVDLTVTTANIDLGLLTYTFLDAGGVNYLPPGVFIDIYPANAQQNLDTHVSSGYVLFGGSVELDLLEHTQYVAVFTGTQAPRQSVTFTSPNSPTDLPAFTIIVPQYTSPILSQAGYAQSLLDQYPHKWLADEYRVPGSVAYPIFSSIGAEFATVDTQLQQIQASMRVQTSEGAALQSWFADFLGPEFAPYPGETDDQYRHRGIVELSSGHCTLQAIQTKVQTYIDANATAQQGTVYCFDLQSDPVNAAAIGIVDGDAKFCVLLPTTVSNQDAFFVEQSNLEVNTYLIPLNILQVATGVDPQIQAIVNRNKAEGTTPVFAQKQT